MLKNVMKPQGQPLCKQNGHNPHAYALSQSFGHVSHRFRSRSFICHRPYVPIMGVPLSSGRLRPVPRGWYCLLCDGHRLNFTTGSCIHATCQSPLSLLPSHRTHYQPRGVGLKRLLDSCTPATGTKGRWGTKDRNQDRWLVWLKLCDRA